jgi:protein TonB
MKKPEYPEAARAKGIEGVVLLQAVISTDGEPLSLKVISSPDPSLSKAAEDAVHQWRYEPTLLNGVPIEVVTNVAVRFHLEDHVASGI